ncbi:universal stress protein [Roseiarcus sp.]|uniref:universal stress protein n=1 Tax=Roseiarcus sp. TaxID=1969460 RepID=UPI003F9E83CD
MAYKDILVYLDPTAESDERLKFAVVLARTNGARLIGVDAGAATGVLEADEGIVTQKEFEDAAGRAGLKALFVPSEKPGEAEAFTHCVDLIVAPAPAGASREVVRKGMLDRALVESGAPMLILPPDWTGGTVGDNVVIAWNGGREALRAVHDAMPFLEKAKKVTVFCFSSRPSDLRASAVMLVEHLATHGVKAHISDWTNTGDLTAIEALFASLDTQDADLIVAGAFSHSRLYEGLFGGVSLDLMRQQSLPVLMSH